MPPGRRARSTASKYVGVVLGADGLEHLDRDDRVVRALDVAVVAQLDVHEVLEAGRADALAREVVLLLRDRDRGHAAAELAGGVQREAAPARADLEHVHARAGSPAPLGDPPVLGPLGVGERLVRRLEDRARVGHRLVEEEPVEVVAQVVVGGDVPARLRPCVLRRARCASVRGSWSGTRHQPSVERERRAVERRELDERHEVRRRPEAVHVRLAGARSRRGAGCGRPPPRRGCGSRRAASDAGSPKTCRRPSGRTTVRQPTRIRAAAARPMRSASDGDRPVGQARQRDGPVSGRSSAPPRRMRATGRGRARRRRPPAVALEPDAAAPQAQGVPVDERRSSAGS